MADGVCSEESATSLTKTIEENLTTLQDDHGEAEEDVLPLDGR